MTDPTHDYDHLAERISDAGHDVAAVERALGALVIETPSWGYGDSGTRFATFQQPGRPRDVFERLERVTGRTVDVVHVIGGGVQAELLCQMTADVLGRRVLAGPVEATALGNVLIQARAAGELGSLADVRAAAAASADPTAYEPSERRAVADGAYERFLAVTGLAVDEPATVDA